MLPFMDLRLVAAGVCAVAGVAILAGPGWALLCAAAILALAPTPDRIRAASQRAVAAWRWLVSSRVRVAISSMPVALVSLAVGVGLMFGAGAALAVAGVSMGGLSLLVGWNQE